MPGWAQLNIDDTIAYQGILTDSNGMSVPDGNYSMRFRLYDAIDSMVWEETQVVPVQNGLYNVLLGSVNALNDVPVWAGYKLGVKVGNDPEMQPRTPLAAVPYALGLRGIRVQPASSVFFGEVPSLIMGAQNLIASDVVGAVIGGGGSYENNPAELNEIKNQSDYGTISGGRANTIEVSSARAVIGGGNANINRSLAGTIGGGEENEVSGAWATVAGGLRNVAVGISATIAGGQLNNITSQYATIGGGVTNTVSGDYGAVSGGTLNAVTGSDGTVSGGQGNKADYRAVVPGGYKNEARGSYSFAAGFQARAAHTGSFVWNHRGATNDSLLSTAADQFLIQAEGGVGIGTNAPGNQVHIVDNINGNGYYNTNYVTLIENTATGSSPDVLALKAGTDDPGSSINFISFFDGDNSNNGSGELLGKVQGSGNGGVEYVSLGADYAEYLPHLGVGEVFESGDVVGVYGGRISKRTAGAQQVMVVSTRPVVVGNMPDVEAGHEKVAFIGQVPVRVVGSVSVGDYIVASGLGDGLARAVRELGAGDQLIGRAWEGSADPDVKQVNVAVGLDRTEVLINQLNQQRRALMALQVEVRALQDWIRGNVQP